MNSDVIGYLPAPFDAVMPEPNQTIAYWVCAAFAVICIGVAIKHGLRYRSFLPVLLLAGSLCAMPIETSVCYFGHAIHAPVGQHVLFETFNRPVPVYFIFMYIFYFGGVFLVLLPRIMRDDFPPSFAWKLYFAICAFAYVVEIVPVHTGMWVYYGKQALWFWKGSQPLNWTFTDSASVFLPIALVKFMYPVLQGWKQLLVIPLIPLGTFMGQLGPGLPVFSVINSPAGNNALWVDLAGLVSIGEALLLIYVCQFLLSAKLISVQSASSTSSV